MKTLIVVDVQNDFVNGSLGSEEAQAIIPNVKKKIEEYYNRGDQIIFTRDTHYDDYLNTLEGCKQKYFWNFAVEKYDMDWRW